MRDLDTGIEHLKNFNELGVTDDCVRPISRGNPLDEKIAKARLGIGGPGSVLIDT